MVESSTAQQVATSSLPITLTGKLGDTDLSYERIMANATTKAFEAALPLSQVVKMSEDQIYAQFPHLEYAQWKPMYTEFQHMDIYCDIHPFKETAILVGQEADSAEQRYINANRIKSIYDEPSTENLIIAAQGPIDSSIRNFWKTVHQENVGMIVTLVHQIPGDCHLYFPTDVGQTDYYGSDITVKLLSAQQEQSFIMRRDFEVTDTGAQTSVRVSHYHFQGWEDWQLPTGKSRSQLVTLVDSAADFVTANYAKAVGDAGRQRLLVHCRAGIGRTGTTLSLVNSTIAIKQQLQAGIADPKLSVFSIVRRLREQRIWMVQTEDQYEYIFEYLRTSKWAKNSSSK